MREHLDDPFVKKAQKEGYRARAAYKLLEIQEKYKLIKPGMTVVDLGAAPGSWSQIAGKLVGDILNEYVKNDMAHYGLPGGPVHDASVIAYLLKPELFSGREVNLVVDTREGPTFGQTIADWYDTLKQPKNAFWVENGDAQGFFDLLTARLGRLQ